MVNCKVMTILVTNDDGILADGLWVLARALKNIGRVVVVAPDREQSAIGTAVTLLQPLRVKRVRPMVPEIETYAVEGTPSDCVILGLEMLAGGNVDLVVSGINNGANLGDDVLISGTVSAALQGYLHNRHAMAISAEVGAGGETLDTAGRLAALLGEWVGSSLWEGKVFLNVNLPDRPLAGIGGVLVTQLASGTHINTAEEGDDGKRKYYWLVRSKNGRVVAGNSDMWAVEQGNISITPLHVSWLNRKAPVIPTGVGDDFFRRLRGG